MAMPKSFEVTPGFAKALALVVSLLIFLIDWRTPVSVNISVFYACVIVILAWTQSPRWIWSWTVLAICLTILSALLTDQGYVGIDVLNRVITVAMLLVTAGFVHFSILTSKQLDANKRLLGEIEERKRAEESLRKAQDELARISRITTMGELAASIAHEVNQPLSGIVINGNAALRWLAGIHIDSPNLVEARQATERIVRDGKRAGDVISRLRNFFKKSSSEKELLDMNEVIGEVVALVRHDIERKDISLISKLEANLPAVFGDSVQLQQVILNLLLNGAEAISVGSNQPRNLIIRTMKDGGEGVRVEVQDAGGGIDPAKLESIFDPFYTTKPGGMGMGLSISRSIIENHGGRLLAETNSSAGAIFHFKLGQHH
jgi:C4-dicarboxylate-specific signal transduction histidine kinase